MTYDLGVGYVNYGEMVLSWRTQNVSDMQIQVFPSRHFFIVSYPCLYTKMEAYIFQFRGTLLNITLFFTATPSKSSQGKHTYWAIFMPLEKFLRLGRIQKHDKGDEIMI